MKRILFSIIALMVISSMNITNAQEVLDGVYIKQHVPQRKPVPYYHLREADVMWSQKIWRILDLKEKINHPLYYPVEPLDDRMSLFSLIMYGVENENLTVYSIADDEFKFPVTVKEIDVILGAVSDTTFSPNLETGEMEQKIIEGSRTPEEIKEFMFKEVWFIDRQRSKLEVRIVGMCPIRNYYRSDDIEQSDLKKSKVCWVYFPAIRHLLANHEVFNPGNDAERRTFDDIFFKRKFSSYVYQETNVYDNRSVNEYKKGLDAQLEAEKIKNKIFTTEHDLWHF